MILTKSTLMTDTTPIIPDTSISGAGVEMSVLTKFFRIGSRDLVRPNVVLLIAANLVPLLGVLFLHWQIFTIMLLFWVENIIIGFFNVLKMLTCTSSGPGKWATKTGFTIFFCVHYGIFTLVHGVFVFVLFSGSLDTGLYSSWGEGTRLLPEGYSLLWAVLALLISHGASFFTNYIGKNEYRVSRLSHLLIQPYARVIVMHITILAGAFLVLALGSPLGGVIALVVVKICVDLLAHLKQHKAAYLENIPA